MKRLILIPLLLISSISFAASPGYVLRQDDEPVTWRDLAAVLNPLNIDIYRRLKDLSIGKIVEIEKKIVRIEEKSSGSTNLFSGRLGEWEINSSNLVSKNLFIDGGQGTLYSRNFNSGVDGWKIWGDGNAEFNDVEVRGIIHASTGSIDNYLNVGDIILDGNNSAIYASSFEDGERDFYIGTEIAEFNNIRARGEFSASIFKTEETSAVGGELIISNATNLAVKFSTSTDYAFAGDSTTLRVNDNVFSSSNTICKIQAFVDGIIQLEYIKIIDTGTLVTGISTHTVPSGQYYAYEVLRNLDGTGANSFREGTAIVSIGRYDPISGESSGYILNDASGANSPYTAVLTRNSTDYNDVTVKFQAGDLGNLTSTEFGSLAGKYGTYVKGDGYFTGEIYGSTITGSVVQTSSYTDVNKVVIDASGIELTSNVEQLGVDSRKILDFNTKGKVELDGKYLTVEFSSYPYRYTQNTWHSDFIEHQYSVIEPLHRMGGMYSSSGVSSTTVIGTVFVPSASKLVALNIAGYKTVGSTITLDVSNFGVSFSTSRFDESDYNLKINSKLLGDDEVTPVSGYFTYHIDLSTMPFGPGYTDLWNLSDDADNDPAGIGQTVVFKVTLIPESDKYDCRFQYIGSMIEIERINNALYYP